MVPGHGSASFATRWRPRTLDFCSPRPSTPHAAWLHTDNIVVHLMHKYFPELLQGMDLVGEPYP